MSVDLQDEDILLRLADTEDSFTERKTVNDLGDCLKTAVAFANSTPIDYPSILFVGVRDNGEIEGVVDPEKIQKSVSAKVANAYPTIYHASRVLVRDGKTFLAFIIPGSPGRPHFAGAAYVRETNKSVQASEPQFDRLIAERSSKAYEILKWRGMVVSKVTFNARISSSTYQAPVVVRDCNQFYVTLANANEPKGTPHSVPLTAIELNYDHNLKCLELRCQSH